MVRAILENRKTQTRRNANGRIAKMDGRTGGWFTRKRNCAHQWTSGLCAWENPYGNPGDRLWVKETHWRFGKWVCNGVTKKGRPAWRFRVTMPTVAFEPPTVKPRRTSEGWHKRPSIFLPRTASRILLEIVKVRVERLQEISADNAAAEGCGMMTNEDGGPVARYCRLWESINGPGAWEANPWVWVIEFKRL
jgi:hypothetical protein